VYIICIYIYVHIYIHTCIYVYIDVIWWLFQKSSRNVQSEIIFICYQDCLSFSARSSFGDIPIEISDISRDSREDLLPPINTSNPTENFEINKTQQTNDYIQENHQKLSPNHIGDFLTNICDKLKNHFQVSSTWRCTVKSQETNLSNLDISPIKHSHRSEIDLRNKKDKIIKKDDDLIWYSSHNLPNFSSILAVPGIIDNTGTILLLYVYVCTYLYTHIIHTYLQMLFHLCIIIVKLF
jgi:hypothetical protein